MRSSGSYRSSASHRAFWKVPPGAPQPSSFVAEPWRVTRRKSRPSRPLPPPSGYLGNGAGAHGSGGAAPKGLVGVGANLASRRSWNLLEPFSPLSKPEMRKSPAGGAWLRSSASPRVPKPVGGRLRPRGREGLGYSDPAGAVCERGKLLEQSCPPLTLLWAPLSGNPLSKKCLSQVGLVPRPIAYALGLAAFHTRSKAA